MDQTKTESELKSALATLETSLSTPVVSGELAAWVDDVQRAWTNAFAQIHKAVVEDHPRQYEEIAKQDSALLPVIETLKAEDEVIGQECEHIGTRVTRDARHAPKLEPDEGKAQKQVQHLVDDGLAFVVRVRKHEVGIETWLVEAFNRDRGAGD